MAAIGARAGLNNPYGYGTPEWVKWQQGERAPVPTAQPVAEETGPWTELNISKEAYQGDWRYSDPEGTNLETGLPYDAEVDSTTGMATVSPEQTAPIYNTPPATPKPIYGQPAAQKTALAPMLVR